MSRKGFFSRKERIIYNSIDISQTLNNSDGLHRNFVHHIRHRRSFDGDDAYVFVFCDVCDDGVQHLPLLQSRHSGLEKFQVSSQKTPMRQQ